MIILVAIDSLIPTRTILHVDCCAVFGQVSAMCTEYVRNLAPTSLVSRNSYRTSIGSGQGSSDSVISHYGPSPLPDGDVEIFMQSM